MVGGGENMCSACMWIAVTCCDPNLSQDQHLETAIKSLNLFSDLQNKPSQNETVLKTIIPASFAQYSEP